MARETDMDNASASSDGQSKARDYSDTTSDTSSTMHLHHAGNGGGAQHHHHQRPKQQHHQKQHHVGGRAHGRAPSSKVLHKSQHHQHAGHHGQAAPKLTRRTTSPTDRSHSRHSAAAQQSAAAHRRSNSEVKLSRNSSSGFLPKSTSHSSLLKRNRSHGEVAKANRSSEKLHRASSGTAINRLKGNKNQVTFDIGDDEPDPEDEWVDASASNSPYMSRKGSLISSGQSSLRPDNNRAQNNNSTNSSSNNSRPETPQNQPSQPASADRSPAEKERLRHKEYLTSRVLKRTASHGAPPQMTADLAQGSLPRHSPDSDGQTASLSTSANQNGSLSTSANQEGLTSRFVETPGSGVISEGSFYNQSGNNVRRAQNGGSRIHSASSFSQSDREHLASDIDNSVLVPRTAGRTIPLPAETSRTQQKLNLQRQSSVLEPGQSLSSVAGVSGANPLIGVGGAGYDGANSRDPRVGRLLERTGMEYLVVRRYQNPIARSLNRLGRLPSLERNKRIPRPNTPLANGKKSAPVDPAARHARNVSMPDPRQSAQPRRVATIRSNGAGSSYDGDDMSRSGMSAHERMSGSSNLGGGEEEEDTSTTLRNLWERSLDLSASAD